MVTTEHSTRPVTHRLAALLAVLILPACGGETEPSTSSGSHWLVCSADPECADYGATCGSSGRCIDSSGEELLDCTRETCSSCYESDTVASVAEDCLADGACYELADGSFCTGTRGESEPCQACLDSGGTWQPEADECTTDCEIADISCFTDTCPL